MPTIVTRGVASPELLDLVAVLALHQWLNISLSQVAVVVVLDRDQGAAQAAIEPLLDFP